MASAYPRGKRRRWFVVGKEYVRAFECQEYKGSSPRVVKMDDLLYRWSSYLNITETQFVVCLAVLAGSAALFLFFRNLAGRER